ncbi:PAS, EAL and GGDEF domain-containing phosphodiesterase [Candidatus Bealeia paramacronuclearis]|uniref:PAS, EAL and GGDEF domain-containing phosphodiesterase n=1 Tax=Candidatus Bealeia paramacronuclearis TaxID=1921001 RepID=A0ABZ2C4D0_9PROT|nr:PAS, EAL and GGDEF domain-containing phosphodiesterase [Candidatus Bealeia paramacronuclearis]
MFENIDESRIRHSLLKKQIKKAEKSTFADPFGYFVALVDQAYLDSDKERRLSEHTMEVMSSELIEANHDLRRQAHELTQTQERYLLAAEAANDGLWDWDLMTDLVYYSIRWRDMLGIPQSIALNSIEDWLSRIHPDYQELVRKEIQQHIEGQSEKIQIEYRIQHHQGHYIWALARGLASRDKIGKAVRIAGSQTDITLRKQYEESLYKAAFHDELTGLTNRALFIDRLDQAIQKSRRLGEKKVAVLFLDLDRFKYINDSMGHEIGDEVLKVVANVLRESTRSTDTVGRLGGDEFTVLLDPINDLQEAKIIAERILKKLNQPYKISGKEIHIASSIGLTLLDPNLPDPQSVLRNADLAMYEAKSTGKARLEVFDHSQHEKVIWRMQMESDLRHCVNCDGLEVYYQPLIDLKTGQIHAFETLLRWNHPEKGFISPDLFIPLAEEVGLIGRIGQSVLEKVIAQVRTWIHTMGIKNTPQIGVNISVRQLMDNHYFELIVSTLKKIGGLRHFIYLEITESVIMRDPNLVIERLKKLTALGIKISIDDFGTGYSSLSYLHNFPFDVLKIDREFISAMIKDKRTERLVSTIIGLAKDLDLKIVAEGIETEAQMKKLQELSCDYGQGYYFAKPMEAVNATAFLLNQKAFDSVRVG